MNTPITETRQPYLTHRGCVVRETWAPIAGGSWGCHIELEGAGIKLKELVEKVRTAPC
jgi:hypothetical protein